MSRSVRQDNSKAQAREVELKATRLDAEDMHIYLHEFDPIGGFVCSECGTPTESEPCEEHQPNAFAAMT